MAAKKSAAIVAPVKKAVAKKKVVKVPPAKDFISISASDPKNGIVELKKFGNGFLLTNSRTGLEQSIAAFSKAKDAFDNQVNAIH